MAHTGSEYLQPVHLREAVAAMMPLLRPCSSRGLIVRAFPSTRTLRRTSTDPVSHTRPPGESIVFMRDTLPFSSWGYTTRRIHTLCGYVPHRVIVHEACSLRGRRVGTLGRWRAGTWRARTDMMLKGPYRMLSLHRATTPPACVCSLVGRQIKTSSSVQPMVTYQGMGCYFGSKKGQ